MRMILMLIFAMSLITLGLVALLVGKFKYQKWLSHVAFIPIVIGIVIATLYLLDFILSYFL